MNESFIHRLIISRQGHQSSYELFEGTFSVGRLKDNDVQLKHFLVSPYHARIVCQGSVCTIFDIGTATHPKGIVVNSVSINPAEAYHLERGDIIQIGPFRLLYERLHEAPYSQTQEITGSSQEMVEDESVIGVSKQLVSTFSENGGNSGTPPDHYLTTTAEAGFYPPVIPPGLARQSKYLIHLLPDIYSQDRLMSQFLALFEAILEPIKSQIENFELFLNPLTAPNHFLPWLMHWFDLTADETWYEGRRRLFLTEANQIYRRRGTAWALNRVLDIYLGFYHGQTAEGEDEVEAEQVRVVDIGDEIPEFFFFVEIPKARSEVNEQIIRQLIEENKPAHTDYKLFFKGEKIG